MKVGILSAIDSATSKIDWGGSPILAYQDFLISSGAVFEFTGFEVSKGQLPAHAEACDAYLITGSPSGAYDTDPWIGQLIQFIRDGYQAGRKFVGICFGHQVLAQALGGSVQKSEKGWGLGAKTHAINHTKPWMDGRPHQMTLYFAHQDQVQRLPPEAELLGGSEFCPIGLYVIADQVLGVQGHPEFKESQMRDVLHQRRLHGFTAAADAAEASLQTKPIDGDRVGRWIVKFLEQ